MITENPHKIKKNYCSTVGGERFFISRGGILHSGMHILSDRVTFYFAFAIMYVNLRQMILRRNV